MSKELSTIQKIIDDEFDSALRKIEYKVTPILEQEFAYVQKKYPGLQAILVGNNNFYFKFKDRSKEHYRFDKLHYFQLPKAFHKLIEIMELVCSYETTFQLVDNIVGKGYSST